MSMYAKVRRMHFREKATVSEIARCTSLSRNTIKKWLKEPERGELTYVRPPGKAKLDPYLAELRQALETDAHRPKRDRRTRLRLFAGKSRETFAPQRQCAEAPERPNQSADGSSTASLTDPNLGVRWLYNPKQTRATFRRMVNWLAKLVSSCGDDGQVAGVFSSPVTQLADG